MMIRSVSAASLLWMGSTHATPHEQPTEHNREGSAKKMAMMNLIRRSTRKTAVGALRRSVKSGDRVISKRLMSFSYPSPRTLQEITNLPLLEVEDSNSIKSIWETHHESQETCVSGTMTGKQYDTLFERLGESPYFVLPVKRDDGHFILLSQAQEKHVLFTYLEDFKNNPESARPDLAVTLYEDFKSSKDLVLVRGDISDMMTKAESTSILHLFTKFYFSDYEWVNTFNNQPNEFDFEKHLENCLNEENTL